MRRRGAAVAAAVGCVMMIMLLAVLNQPLDRRMSVMIPRSSVGASAVIDSIRSNAGKRHAWVTSTLVSVGLKITSRKVLPGWYHLARDASALDIATMIVFGRREPLVKVTIPEGFTIERIARRLTVRAGIDSAAFRLWCQSDSVLRRFDVHAPSMEGFLMPDTYFMIRGDDARYVAELMAAQAQRVWSSLSGVDSLADWNTRLRLATLASIVQLEAAVDDEMPTIAGVYTNRLRIGMLLQADPTVQYLTGRDRITASELRDASNRYNTYVYKGLPPGPIGNPGRRALEAACRPEIHEWIFFVARGDTSRRHRFARTLEEHNANVRLYRTARRESSLN
ncbi:MAG: endolytic transglycosylase MltG [Candidatus Kapabacteria bacterium]|nr:endolytic transglycosylase MltG [Candidatus Kapabacteria bacterium]